MIINIHRSHEYLVLTAYVELNNKPLYTYTVKDNWSDIASHRLFDTAEEAEEAAINYIDSSEGIYKHKNSHTFMKNH